MAGSAPHRWGFMRDGSSVLDLFPKQQQQQKQQQKQQQQQQQQPPPQQQGSNKVKHGNRSHKVCSLTRGQRMNGLLLGSTCAVLSVSEHALRARRHLLSQPRFPLPESNLSMLVAWLLICAKRRIRIHAKNHRNGMAWHSLHGKERRRSASCHPIATVLLLWSALDF